MNDKKGSAILKQSETHPTEILEVPMMRENQHYMTYTERIKLETLLGEKKPIAQIAETLGFSRQAIYNEKKLGSYMHDCGWYEEERYSADRAEAIHRKNQANKGRNLKIGNNHSFAQFVEKKIVKEKFSPAAALAAAKDEGFKFSICTSTLYSYIGKGVFLHLTTEHLWEKGKRKKHKKSSVKRIAHPKLPSIEERPEEINERKESGHWEMDLIVGKKGTKPTLLTLTERKTRREMIFKLPDKRAITIRKVFDNLEKKYKDFKTRFKSITTDNGSEFLEFDKLTESIHGGKRFDIYYCHSYASWEKGSNENHNRMIRRFFPKGTDFSKVTKKEVEKVERWMNNYPRKILGWKTPLQAA